MVKGSGEAAIRAFVRGIWSNIPSTQDLSWVQAVAAEPEDPEGLHGDHGVLVRRMLDAGVSEYDIARFAKISSYLTAFGICYLLDDPEASYEGMDDSEKAFAWDLEVVDYQTGEPIPGLGPLKFVRSYLPGGDPTGRGMMPEHRPS